MKFHRKKQLKLLHGKYKVHEKRKKCPIKDGIVTKELS